MEQVWRSGNALVGLMKNISLFFWRVGRIDWCFSKGCNPSVPWFDSRHLFHRGFFAYKKHDGTGAESQLLGFRLESKSTVMFLSSKTDELGSRVLSLMVALRRKT